LEAAHISLWKKLNLPLMGLLNSMGILQSFMFLRGRAFWMSRWTHPAIFIVEEKSTTNKENALE
jgi:hypothetical protein